MSPQPADTLLRQWLIRSDQDGYTQYATTRPSDGRYLAAALQGEVSLQAVAPGVYWETCPEALTVTPADFTDTLQAPDLAAAPEVFCPLLEVELGAALLRRCFDNTYVVHYANRGTTTALNTEVEITLDPWFTFLSADRPLLAQTGQTLRFALGDLAPNASGQFSMQFTISCDAPLGALHSTAAHIYPDTLCGPLSWPGAVIRAAATCLGDTAVAFTLTNTGGLAMATPLPWSICANWCGQYVGNGSFSLCAGQSQTFTFPVESNLPDAQFEFSMEAGQEAGYPFGSNLSASIFGCPNNPVWTQPGYTLLPDNAGEPFLDLDQKWNNGSWDPNEKSAEPAGLGPKHLIRPETPIQYQIRFQNTGTDTAFSVSIRDTLSALLDPGSFRAGASSHPFTWEMSGSGNLVFHFDPILLPDSNTNEAASHGFVQYTVTPKATAPLGAILRNRAAVYFDFNQPVGTNEVWHTLAGDFFPTGTAGPAGAKNPPMLLAAPNPFSERTLFSWQNLPGRPIRLEVMDVVGKQVCFQLLDAGLEQIAFQRGALPAGVYMVFIYGEKGWMASARLLVQ